MSIEVDLKQFFTKEANETFLKWKKEVLKNSIQDKSVKLPTTVTVTPYYKEIFNE